MAGLPRSLIELLERFQDAAAARLVIDLRPHDQNISALVKLHQLLIHFKLTYKLCLLKHLIHTGQHWSTPVRPRII
jgi:hypothetical protein